MQKRLLALVATVAMVLSMFAGIAFADTGPSLEEVYAYRNPGDGNLILVVDAKNIQSNYFLEVDHTLDKNEFSAPARNLTEDEADALKSEGVSMSYDSETEAWTFDFGDKHSETILKNANFKFYFVIKDDEGNELFGSMDPTTPENTFALSEILQTYEIVLDEEYFVASGDEDETFAITGEIVDNDGHRITGRVIANIDGDDGDGTIAGLDSWGEFVYDGIINIELPGDFAEGRYRLSIDSDDYYIEPVKFDVIPGEAVTDDDLVVDWGKDLEYSGRLPSGVRSAEVRLLVPDATGTKQISIREGKVNRVFAFTVNKSEFVKPGVIRLQYKTEKGQWVTFATGKIASVAVDSKLSLDPASVIYGLDKKEDITLELDTEKLDLRGTVTYKYELGKIEKAENETVASHKFKNVEFEREHYGTHTAKVTVYIHGEVAYTASKTFTVEMPSNTNVLGIPAEATVADGLDISGLRVFYEDGKTMKEAPKLVVIAEGPGIEKGEVDIDEKLYPTHAGVITLTIKAYDAEDELVATETVEVEVTGASMVIEPAEVEVGTETTIVIELKDEDGKPINNANIQFGTHDPFTAAKLNPNNGIYEIEVEEDDALVAKPGELVVVATVGEDVVARGKFTVVGKNVYEVIIDHEEGILAGREVELDVEVLDENGKAITPHTFQIVTPSGTKEEPINGAKSIEYTAVEAGTYTLIARNRDLSKVGSATFEVVKPVLELSVDNLTNNVKSAVTAKVVDPTDDNAVLKWNLLVQAEHATLEALELNGKKIAVGRLGTEQLNLGKAEEYELVVLLAGADYEAAEEAEEVAGLKFYVVGDEEVELEVMPVADAKLIADPEQPVFGQAGTLTLTLVDANEAPLAGYKVTTVEGEVGKTDENGEVTYASRMTGNITFTAHLDAEDSKVDLTVKPTDDFEAPQVTYEVDGNKATLIITDNVRLVRVEIDGEEVDLWPAAEYRHEVTLTPGLNKFRVRAQDNNYNVLNEVVEIEYKTESVVLEGEKVQRQGEYLFVQLRQFEELGAEIGWNGETRVATFVVGDTKVEVTIGSTTAKVNGEAVTMPVAAFIDAAQGRTYVPVRFVSESLGWNVHWAQGDIVTITLP